MEAFRIEHLNFTYPDEKNNALKDISFSVQSGEILTICGASGCGKSTLLRHLKSVLTPFGTRSGTVYFHGKPLNELEKREDVQKIGFVAQSADNQIVTDKVYHELAFGLESLGFENSKIRQRVAEISSFFGIQNWFYKDVNALSGGQKQILSLASVMTMLPEVLILDEPTSQLDTIAASEFLNMLVRINRELGVTIIITEHRLDEILPYSDHVLVLDNGRCIAHDTPKQVCLQLKENHHKMFLSMPVPMRIWSEVPDAGENCPLTVNEGRIWLNQYVKEHALENKEVNWKDMSNSGHGRQQKKGDKSVIEANDVWFQYAKGEADVLKGVHFSVKQGEMAAILGGNGTGKSTLLSVIAGMRKQSRGKIHINGKLAMLPQNPKNLFVGKTVYEDLEEVKSTMSQEKKDEIISLCALKNLLQKNPYDLSGGEQQRAAFAKVLLTQADILLLDEPTKGMDSEFKQEFGKLLTELAKQKITILMVSHDIEFCAEWMNRCALFFDGDIISQNETRAFFKNNNFYTTSANRMARNTFPEAVLTEDVILCCKSFADNRSGQENDFEINEDSKPDDSAVQDKEFMQNKDSKPDDNFVQDKDFKLDDNADTENPLQINTEEPISIEHKKRKRLYQMTAAIMLAAIPLTIFAGVYIWDDRKYLFISLLVLLECMVPFFLLYEGKNPGARDLVMVSVICAICVAGRMLTYMLPQFKPVMALVIIAGVCLGAETGFLVGAVTMLVSNIVFVQGPWTPWQMFAMGIVGFFAGVLFSRKQSENRFRTFKGKIILCVYGFFAAVVIYGGIMNPASAIMSHAKLNWKTLLSFYATGLPMDATQGVATSVCLFFLINPIRDKIERVKQKYGCGK